MSARPTDLDAAAAAWLGAARAGDQEAWTRLVRAVHPSVYRWAFGLAGDPDEADDIAQDTLIRLHRHLGGFAGRSRLSVWLYRVTWNVAASRRRRAWGRRRTPLESLQRMEPGTDDDPERGIDVRAIQVLVEEAFRALPRRQRAAFDLVDLQGLAPAEAAELLDMNPSTFRVHLLRARRAIRSLILARAPALAPEDAG